MPIVNTRAWVYVRPNINLVVAELGRTPPLGLVSIEDPPPRRYTFSPFGRCFSVFPRNLRRGKPKLTLGDLNWTGTKSKFDTAYTTPRANPTLAG